VALRVANTANLTTAGDTVAAVDTTAVMKDTTDVGLDGLRVLDAAAAAHRRRASCKPAALLPPALAGLAPAAPAADRTIPSSALTRRDRSAIVVDQWGPYDWRSPKLWPVDSAHAVPLRLAVLGPPGSWTLVAAQGVGTMTPRSGRTGDTVTVTPAPDSTGNWEVTLEYRGGATVSPRGDPQPAGAPSTFSYGRFEPGMAWQVRFFTWSDSTDPRTKPQAFDSLLASTPLLTRDESRLDYEWYGPAIKQLPVERWALEATSTVELAPGLYTLRTISDDAVRVWVDDSLAIDDWKPHGSTIDAVPIGAGRHRLRVEYYQVDGWTEFRLDLLRGALTFAQPPGEE
jgi:PA14 domain